MGFWQTRKGRRLIKVAQAKRAKAQAAPIRAEPAPAPKPEPKPEKPARPAVPVRWALVPWPEYGAHHTPSWRVVVRAAGKRLPERDYLLRYSSRLCRFARAGETEALASVVGQDLIDQIEDDVRRRVQPMFA